MKLIEKTTATISEIGIENAKRVKRIAERSAATGLIFVHDIAVDYLTRRMAMSDIDWKDPEAVLKEIEAVLYGGDEDKEWSPDTIEDVAYLVNRWVDAQSGS